MEQVRKIAEIATKGPVMIRSMDLFESAVFAPQASFGGEYLHKDFFQQAAALMRSLAENQPLVDGNKRTAWLSVVTFAELNGWTIEATEDHETQIPITSLGGFAIEHLRFRAVSTAPPVLERLSIAALCRP